MIHLNFYFDTSDYEIESARELVTETLPTAAEHGKKQTSNNNEIQVSSLRRCEWLMLEIVAERKLIEQYFDAAGFERLWCGNRIH